MILKLNPPTTSNGRSYNIDTEEFNNIAMIVLVKHDCQPNKYFHFILFAITVSLYDCT